MDTLPDPSPAPASLNSPAERLALAATVLANVDAHIYVKDRQGRYLFINEKVMELYNRSAEEVLGRTDLELMDPVIATRLMAIDKLALDTMSRQACEEIVVDREGRTRHYWSVKMPLEREDGSACLVGFSTEITELLRLRQTLERQRITDPLTGLANRVQMEEDLSIELRLATREQQQLAVVLLDLDQFKYINTHLGHDAGDQLLREAAQRLRQALPVGSSLARLGGDEFAAVLPALADAPAAALQ
uniref:GGDEF domain-containing protein n=1 Tax=Pelomonas sp. KK5 TaxID=1855730 RepID=UPI00117DDD5D